MSNKPLKKDEIKRRIKKKKRRQGIKLVQPNRYLIICEGEKTEPYYFKGIQKRIEIKYNKRINVISYPLLQIKGTGKSCLALLDYAKKVVKKEKRQNRDYDFVWLVYDLDDFSCDDFNNTAYEVEAMNNNHNDEEKWFAAWSNQCIELWFLLHFNYYDTDIYRGEYFYKLTKIFSKYNIGEYKKNNEDIFELLMKYGNLDKAINNAKQLYKKHNGNPPSKMAPATRVYELVEELKPHIV